MHARQPITRQPDPEEFEQCVSHLCSKIEAVAIREGASDTDCHDLESTLAMMPPLVRERVQLALEAIQIQTEYDHPAMCFAARYALRLAEDVWETNPHPMTRSVQLSAMRSKPG